MRRILHIILVAALLITGCKKEEPLCLAEGEPARAYLQLGTMKPGSITISEGLEGTRAIHDPGTFEAAADIIKNLWIIQYNGTADNATLLGEPIYIEDFSSFDGTVKLVSSKTPTTVILLANTFENKDNFAIAQGSTLADMKARTRIVSAQESIMGNDNGTYHPIMFAQVQPQMVVESMEIEATLMRNIARMDFTITNNTTGAEKVTITDAQVCSIPQVSYYLPDSSSDQFPQTASLSTTDYAPLAWPAEGNSLSFTTYIPVNKRGITGNTSAAAKNINPPKGSTYLVLNGKYTKNGEEVPVSYTFYLGGDFTGNYNLLPNSKYTYNIEINALGNSATDSRVNDWAMMDYTSSKFPHANSYILNPIPSGTTKRVFRIPVGRIATFWGSANRAIYENDRYYSLRDNNGAWKAFVLTSDFEISDNNFILSKNTGTLDSDPYFEVKVAPGTSGNVIIAAGPNDGSGEISWSWHLWITDYNPYQALDWNSSTNGEYIYPVTGGSVHRYEGAWWKANSKVFIMDRNMGALSDYEYPESISGQTQGRGLLYYQFGRKDPFFIDNDTYKINRNKRKNVEYNTANSTNGVLYSIHNPMTFIKGTPYQNNNTTVYTSWANGNKYNPTEFDSRIIWYDPTTVPGSVNEGKKSIFDPCPPGYRMPDKTIWSDFRIHTDPKPTTNVFKNGHYADKTEILDSYYINGFKPYNKIKGLQYWPYMGENILIPDKVVYIPASGFIAPTGTINHHGNLPTDNLVNGAGEKWSFLWSEDGYTENEGLGYTAQQDHLNATNSVSSSRAFPVRCITDNY